jgi:hypothetical protein
MINVLYAMNYYLGIAKPRRNHASSIRDISK